jgi:hypothetical protein
MNALNRAVAENARGERSAAIAGLTELLQRATAVMRVSIGDVLGDDGLIDWARVRALPPDQRAALSITAKTWTDRRNRVHTRQSVKREYAALKAVELLIDHYRRCS